MNWSILSQVCLPHYFQFWVFFPSTEGLRWSRCSKFQRKVLLWKRRCGPFTLSILMFIQRVVKQKGKCTQECSGRTWSRASRDTCEWLQGPWSKSSCEPEAISQGEQFTFISYLREASGHVRTAGGSRWRWKPDSQCNEKSWKNLVQMRIIQEAKTPLKLLQPWKFFFVCQKFSN